MASEKISGRLYCFVDGIRMDLAGTASYDSADDEEELMVGPDGNVKSKATPQSANIELEFFSTRDFMTNQYPRLKANGGKLTLRLELANGVNVTMTGATCLSRFSSNAVEGKTTLKFGSDNLNFV